MFAADHGHIEATRLLLHHGADPKSLTVGLRVACPTTANALAVARSLGSRCFYR